LYRVVGPESSPPRAATAGTSCSSCCGACGTPTRTTSSTVVSGAHHRCCACGHHFSAARHDADLKPANLLVTKNCDLVRRLPVAPPSPPVSPILCHVRGPRVQVISDFGLARQIPDATEAVMTQVSDRHRAGGHPSVAMPPDRSPPPPFSVERRRARGDALVPRARAHAQR